MAIIAKNSGGDFKLPEEGTKLGRCVHIIELGTQPSQNFGPGYKIMLGFELPDDVMERDGVQVPVIQHKEYTLSLSDKANLRHDLETWRGKKFTEEELKGFDICPVLRKAAMLTITHKVSKSSGKTRAEITAVAGLPKGFQAPPQVHPHLLYELGMVRGGTFALLPEWIQDKILDAQEFKSGAQPERNQPDQQKLKQAFNAGPTSPTNPEPAEPVEDDVPF